MKVTKEIERISETTMGMAAGQARLLSITSRMSDNELRAQIINNQKMRLATESSQVSEAYVNALNQSQMMFTNYDADNNTSYQQLTFNSLTSYNPYNNQYGLVNASGQLLVSEKDATNFEKANGNMETFLGYYGLEENTTYFDELEKNYSNVIYKDADGNTLWDPAANDYHIPIMATDQNGVTTYVDSGYTAEELKDMFMGYNGHRGYDAALSSSTYNDYLGYAEKFDAAYTTYATAIADIIATKFESLGASEIQVYLDGDTASEGENTIYLEKLRNLIINSKDNSDYKTNAETKAYFDELIGTDGNSGKIVDLINGKNIETIGGTNGTFATSGENGVIIDDSMLITKTDDGKYILQLVQAVIETNSEGKETITGYEPVTETVETESGPVEQAALNVTLNPDNSGYEASNGVTYTFGASIEELYNTALDKAKGNNPNLDKCYITATSKMTADEIKSEMESVFDKLKNDVYVLWSGNDEIYTYDAGGKETEAHRAYREAAAAFMAHLLGGEAQEVSYAEKNKGADIVAITVNGNSYTISLSTINAIATDTASLQDFIINGVTATGKDGETKLKPASDELQDLVDVIVLNNVMNTYGEPKVTWIDVNNPNENGEAKYNWYSNLFTRMQQGYKTLQDGLASSNEWIQFALESGIVTMEQVDSENNWNGLNYANCSDITEQTNDTAVSIAEAEYNAAMNKIENKDKKYDLELKNIDTEHNSLQTEYDSIKSAIDKNIERTFKIYS